MAKVKAHMDSIEFPVFGYTLFFIHTTDIYKTRLTLNSKVGETTISPNDCVGLHACNKNANEAYILFTKNSSVGTICHEVSHAICSIFEYIGAAFENEMFAYHLGYTIDKIMEFKSKIENK